MRTHILIADDEPLTRNSLQEALRYEGYNVSIADNPVKALEILGQYPVDIVLTDMKMPSIDGFDLLKKIKQDYPTTYVVLMSACGNIENAVTAMRYGAFDYITKPIDDEQLKGLIKKISLEEESNESINLEEDIEELEVEKSVRGQFYNI
ncbi:MAG: response regulator, partial [Candidatus Heimdallarchaeota archaeon]|nr:response regulator [Candidatus Heimdallarchaeota archaeon]